MALTKTITGLFLFSVVISLIVSPLLLVCPQVAQAEEPEVNESEVEYWAVIVGVSDYQLDILDLPNISDAEDLYGELAPIWGKDHIKLLMDKEATKVNISNAITRWLDEHEDSNDVVFFDFSGHGKEYHLAPYESSRNISGPTSITANELQGWLDELESDNIVVILDSCLSGSFINALSKTGRIILSSSEAGERSWYFTSLGHLVFTHYILGAFGNLSIVDSNEDYEVSAEEIFAYAAPRVIDTMESWDKSQNPQMDDRYDGDLGLFYVGVYDMSQHFASIVIDGIEYTKDEMPITLKYTPWSVHSCEVLAVVNVSSGTRYQFTYWSDGNTSPSRYINCGGEYTANYITSYYLGIESEYGSPSGDGWYYVGTNASVSVPASDGLIVRKVFTGWSGDINSSTPETNVYMDRPISAIANWRSDYSQLYMLVFGLLAVIAVGTFFFIRRRRKIRLITTPTEVALPSAQQDESNAPQ